MHTSSKSTAKDWFTAARPRTLGIAAVPVLLGSALAFRDGTFLIDRAVVALLAALAIQIGTNFANDLFDFLKGADTEERIGPPRAVQSGAVSPGQMKLAVVIVFSLSALLGLYLVTQAGWPVLVIGLLSIASGVAYTGGPYPLGYHGLGELFVFVFFGLVAVCGTYYVQALRLSWQVVAFSVPVGLFATAVLVVNNLRDIQTDARAGKRTLAVRMGRRATQAFYTLCLLAALASAPLLWAAGSAAPWMLLPLLVTPSVGRLIAAVYTGTDGPALIEVLGKTAKAGVAFGALMTAAIVIEALP